MLEYNKSLMRQQSHRRRPERLCRTLII